MQPHLGLGLTLDVQLLYPEREHSSNRLKKNTQLLFEKKEIFQGFKPKHPTHACQEGRENGKGCS